MVWQLSMSSKLGVQHFSNEDISQHLMSDETKHENDLEVKRILRESYDRAKNVLQVNLLKYIKLRNSISNNSAYAGSSPQK